MMSFFDHYTDSITPELVYDFFKYIDNEVFPAKVKENKLGSC
jgi:hypothetical protein